MNEIRRITDLEITAAELIPRPRVKLSFDRRVKELESLLWRAQATIDEQARALAAARRECEALQRALAESECKTKRLSVETLQRLAKDLAARSDAALVARTMEVVGLITGVRPSEICGRSQVFEVVRARHIVCALLSRIGLSANAIGRAIRRDHSSVLAGKLRMADLAERDPAFAAMLDDLAAKLILPDAEAAAL